MNQKHIAVGIAVLAVLFLAGAIHLPGSLFSNGDCTSYTSIGTLSSDNTTFTVQINQQRAFNSQWGSDQFSACIANFGSRPDQQFVSDHANEFSFKSIVGAADSGCGDIVPFQSMDIQGHVTLARSFSEQSLPACYSVNRRPGWADGLNVGYSGTAVFSRTPVPSSTIPILNGRCPSGQSLNGNGICVPPLANPTDPITGIIAGIQQAFANLWQGLLRLFGGHA